MIMLKVLILGLVTLVTVGLIGIKFVQEKFGPIIPLSGKSNTTEITGTQKPKRITTIATNLEVPWAMDFLPNGDILFTERTGKLKLVSNGQVNDVATIPDVKVYGEGGLMGLAIHPDFENNNYIYLMLTYSGDGNNTLNRVVRYNYEDGKLNDRKIIVDQIPGAIYHNGGRIKFGPDKYLYITTGDSLEPSLAQDKNSLAGKILRVTDDGSPAPENPFKNQIYSIGHRNPQGLTWDNEGRLWSTEHGRSSPSGFDEVNIIIRGRNYGWPEIQGSETRNGMESPLAQSGQETWAPGGAVFHEESLFFTGLRGEALYELRIENGNAIISNHLLNEYGRIRDVLIGPDNLLYISTSNRDGRGKPSNEDDKILQIDPDQL